MIFEQLPAGLEPSQIPFLGLELPFPLLLSPQALHVQAVDVAHLSERGLQVPSTVQVLLEPAEVGTPSLQQGGPAAHPVAVRGVVDRHAGVGPPGMCQEHRVSKYIYIYIHTKEPVVFPAGAATGLLPPTPPDPGTSAIQRTRPGTPRPSGAAKGRR